MDGRKVAREVRLRYWSGVIQARQQSGQTIREYCGENGVNEKSYYYWQNRLREAACEALAVRQENGATPTFSEIPLPLSRSSQHAAITIRTGDSVVEIGRQRNSGIDRASLEGDAIIMLGDVSRAERIYIACGYTDMRKSIDGLSELVQQRFKLDPFSNSLFLFCGRRCDRLKALYWEGDGLLRKCVELHMNQRSCSFTFVLLYKRLERGVFQWPRKESEVRDITPQQFRWLMEGLAVEQPKAHRPVKGLKIS